jgi:hypothetical protein
MIDGVMNLLQDGLGRRVVEDVNYVYVMQQATPLPAGASDQQQRLAALDRTCTKERLAEALGWEPDVAKNVTPIKGGWRVRLMKDHRTTPQRELLLQADVVVSKKITEAHGSGLELSIHKSKVVLTSYPVDQSLEPEAVAEHLDFDVSFIGSAVRRQDEVVVVTLTEDGLPQRSLLVESKANIHDLHVMLLTKGWDAVRNCCLLMP